MNPQRLFARPLTKRVALDLLGGNAVEAARLIGISPQAVRKWPAILSPTLADRVEAAWHRVQDFHGKEAKRRWAYEQETGHPFPDELA